MAPGEGTLIAGAPGTGKLTVGVPYWTAMSGAAAQMDTQILLLQGLQNS